MTHHHSDAVTLLRLGMSGSSDRVLANTDRSGPCRITARESYRDCMLLKARPILAHRERTASRSKPSSRKDCFTTKVWIQNRAV